jgi:hypothetical protein
VRHGRHLLALDGVALINYKQGIHSPPNMPPLTVIKLSSKQGAT